MHLFGGYLKYQYINKILEKRNFKIKVTFINLLPVAQNLSRVLRTSKP